MSAPLPLVSLIIPCRNEVRHIRTCVESLLAMDYPAERLEILVMDGLSEDGTRAIVEGLAASDPRVRLVDNPGRITSCALNLGVRASTGEAVMLIGAHSEYPVHYVRALVGHLQRSGAEAVGGVCRTVAGTATPVAEAIAAVLGHPFGVGNSYFRIGATAPLWVDTVPFGCYRRDVFERFGLFDEELVRNQDDEFNLRIVRGGGRLLLVPDVTCEYRARDSFPQVARMFYQYGLYKPLVARKLGRVMTLRQLAPATLVIGLLAALLLPLVLPIGWGPALALIGGYGLVDLICAWRLRLGWPKAAAAAMLAFPVIHLSYGLGFLVGSFRLLRGWGRWKEGTKPLPISR